MIRAGDAQVVVAGGMESMSNAPYVLAKARFGYRLGDGVLIDSMVHDGLTSSFDGKHMVEQASFVSRELGITREEQDEWALRSQQRAVNAIDNGPLRRRDRRRSGTSPSTRRRGATRRSRSSRRSSPSSIPRERRPPGNAPGVNDGAGALIVMSEEVAKERGIEPLATIVAQAAVADEFAYLARTPAKAGALALEKAGKTIGDVDRVEVNEAFASVVAELGADARRRSRDGERERRRGRARASDRRVRRADPRRR